MEAPGSVTHGKRLPRYGVRTLPTNVSSRLVVRRFVRSGTRGFSPPPYFCSARDLSVSRETVPRLPSSCPHQDSADGTQRWMSQCVGVTVFPAWRSWFVLPSSHGEGRFHVKQSTRPPDASDRTNCDYCGKLRSPKVVPLRDAQAQIKIRVRSIPVQKTALPPHVRSAACTACVGLCMGIVQAMHNRTTAPPHRRTTDLQFRLLPID